MITFSCMMARTFPKYLGNRYRARPVCTCPNEGGDSNGDEVPAVAAQDHTSSCGLYRNPRYHYFDEFEMNEELVVIFNCPEHRVCAGCFLDTIKKIEPYQWYASGCVVSRGNVRAVLEFGDRDLVRGQAIIEAIETIVRICVPPAVNEDRRILGGRVAINENGAYIAITNVPEYLEIQ